MGSKKKSEGLEVVAWEIEYPGGVRNLTYSANRAQRAECAGYPVRRLSDAQSGVEREREEGREEAMATMKPELYRLANLETWARRIIGNALIHARDAKAELNRDEEENGDHSLQRTSLRHAGGHLHRLVEILSQPLPSPPPEREPGQLAPGGEGLEPGEEGRW